MQIDKTRFLALAMTLAGTTVLALQTATTGCTTTNGSGDAAAPPSSGATTAEDAGPTRDAALDPDADGGGCLGATGSAPLCGPANEGEDAAGFAKCAFECGDLADVFKSDIAREMNRCLDDAASGPTFEGCSAAADPCVEAALAKACDDPAAVTYCDALAPRCADAGDASFEKPECVRIVRALSPSGKTALERCLDDGQSTCVECLLSMTSTLY